MEWELYWEPGLPMSPGALGQDDQQQLLWGYPGILWGAVAAIANAIFDLNTRLQKAFSDHFSYSPPVDLNSVFNRYLATKTGDATKRLLDAIDDATL